MVVTQLSVWNSSLHSIAAVQLQWNWKLSRTSVKAQNIRTRPNLLCVVSLVPGVAGGVPIHQLKKDKQHMQDFCNWKKTFNFTENRLRAYQLQQVPAPWQAGQRRDGLHSVVGSTGLRAHSLPGESEDGWGCFPVRKGHNQKQTLNRAISKVALHDDIAEERWEERKKEGKEHRE